MPFVGRYLNGRDGRSVEVECTADSNSGLRIRGDGVDRLVPLAAMRTSSRLGNTHRTLYLGDGALVQTLDNDAVDALFPHQNRFEALVERLERHWRAVLAAVCVTLAAAVMFFELALPWIAGRVANHIPAALERSLGEQALAQLRRFVLEPSTLPAKRRAHLRARFADFVRDLPQPGQYRLEFFNARLGANAFALPGGIIVFTDDLVRLIDNDDEFLAVSAHEIGHERHHHLLRSVLQDSGVVVVVTLVAGDAGSASTLVAGIPTFLLQLHYSRAFEADADAYAFKTLAAHGISPQAFADVMRKLQKARPETKGGIAYLSSHPPTAERIRRAEEAGRRFARQRRADAPVSPAPAPARGSP